MNINQVVDAGIAKALLGSTYVYFKIRAVYNYI